ncbi:hypothetical protein CIK74_09475 [Glutamicibacter sp. BW77]|nr:hypothetical protein CIK74_09475 [Glutamicibacter sp. BW77]
MSPSTQPSHRSSLNLVQKLIGANRLLKNSELLPDYRLNSSCIRVNDRWRICFTWKVGGAQDVELVDYH